MDRAVTDTIQGVDGVRRLILNLPPRHGKSHYASQYLPSWFLGTFPERRVILTSYEASFAATWGRKSRNILHEHGYLFGVKVADSPAAADYWELASHAGGMVTAGAGGAITGKGADLIIVDDPHKNAEEANSKIMRDKVWDWYQSTLYTRLEPDGVVIVIQTRWNEDDLSGRLIKEAMSGDGDQWRILKLPAIDDDGNALWFDRFSTRRLQEIRKAIGDYHFESLYQQNPTPREGSFFKVGKLNYMDVSDVPKDIQWCRAWDFAATEGDGDYTAGPKVGIDNYGRVIIADMQRGQWATDERNERLRSAARMDGRDVIVRLPEDPGQAGKDQSLAMARMLNGYILSIVRVSGAKETRADPLSGQVNAGNVWIVRGDWNAEFVEELRQFPRGKHDDQVDAVADAYAELCNIPEFDDEPEFSYARI